MTKSNDTIFALSSGSTPSGIAVVRLSGPSAFTVVAAMVESLPASRQASVRRIRNRNGLVIDTGIVLVFPAPHSFTGEDCAELHVHGGRAVVTALLNDLSLHAGCRLAENGEFSRRAFDNGTMDLLEAEGLADLLTAETEMQRRLAVEHSFGGLSKLYTEWADRLTRGRALIEAELDFSDEGDIPGSVSDLIWKDMREISALLASHLEGARFGEIIRDGLKVAIVGPPNSGKSSLMNALAARDVAIVTDIPGTTRDVLQVHLDIDGYSVQLYDTAGIRDAVDIVEAEGVRRALIAMEGADIVLSLAEIGTEIMPTLVHQLVIAIGTKADLHGVSDAYDIVISTQSNFGLDRLRQRLSGELARLTQGVTMAIPARRRHRLLLAETLASLDAAINGEQLGLDIRAEHLRSAAQALGRITGRVDVEDLLGVIFSEFCVGK